TVARPGAQAVSTRSESRAALADWNCARGASQAGSTTASTTRTRSTYRQVWRSDRHAAGLSAWRVAVPGDAVLVCRHGGGVVVRAEDGLLTRKDCPLSSYRTIILSLNTEHGWVIAHEEALNVDIDPMLHAAGVRLSDWDGIPVQECRPILESLIMRLESDPGRYQALAPEEGDYQETCNRLHRLLAAMRAEPDALAGVS